MSSRRSRNESEKRSSTARRSSLGWKAQSKPARVFRTLRPLPLMRHSMLRSRLRATAWASRRSTASRSVAWCTLAQVRCASTSSPARPRRWRCWLIRCPHSSAWAWLGLGSLRLGTGALLRPLAGGRRVVLGEVGGLGVAAREEALELVGGGAGGVLVEPPHRGAGDEDALDGAVLEGAVGQGVRQRADEVGRVEAGAQRQDAPGVVAGRARLGLLQGGEEALGGIAHLGEGSAQLTEVRAAVGLSGPMPRQRRVLAGAARLELVARDAGQVRLVDPQLLLRHPHRPG